MVVLLRSSSVMPCCEMKENVNKSNSKPDNHDTREIETSFMVLLPRVQAPKLLLPALTAEGASVIARVRSAAGALRR